MMHTLKTIFFALIFTVCLCISMAYAHDSDSNLLRISFKVFPRLVAVDLDISKKLTVNKELELLVLYSIQKDHAEEAVLYLNEKVRTIASMKVVATSSDKLPPEAPAGILIIDKFTEAELRAIISYGIKNHIIIFSPFEEDVKYGVTAGMSVQIRIFPCFNRGNLKKSKIRIHDIILKSSKIYE